MVEVGNLLIGCTGSVAALKLPDLLKKFAEQSVSNIKVVLTEHSKHFIDFTSIPDTVEILSDTDEWSRWTNRGDPVLHIDLSKWADIFLIAPLDANTLAKISGGLCDNLLTCVARAWDPAKTLIFCPAMNTKMWNHPVTAHQINILESWGYEQIPVISKTLICGDTGLGAMAEVDTIVERVSQHPALTKVLSSS